MVIFTDLLGIAVPVNLGLLSIKDSDALGVVILISPLFPAGGEILSWAGIVASSFVEISVKSYTCSSVTGGIEEAFLKGIFRLVFKFCLRKVTVMISSAWIVR